jgi:hypothetical protein
MALEYNPDRTCQLFSISLNGAFFRRLRCGGTLVTPAVIKGYHIIFRGLSVTEKRIIADSGAWPALISLLDHRSCDVVEGAGWAMGRVTEGRAGEDYAQFVEGNFFDELLKKIPPHPVRATVKIPFVEYTECVSEDFEGLGCIWCDIAAHSFLWLFFSVMVLIQECRHTTRC